MLTLWHCEDSRSFRVVWAMEELGLDYRLRMLRFPPRVFQKDYLGENPLGTVPLLVDGETRMTESTAIMHYLAMRHAQGRLVPPPGDPTYGAYLNWLVHGEATLTFPQTIFLRYTRLEPEERRQLQAADDYRRWFLARLRLLDASLAQTGPYLTGPDFTLADISVGYAIMLALTLGLKDELPARALDWFSRLQERPAFASAKARQRRDADEQGIGAATL